MEARTTLITGGAKRLGKAMATHLAVRGYNIILHYNKSANEANALAEMLQKNYAVKVILWQADLNSLSAANLENLPNFDILINNASLFEQDYFSNCEKESLQRHYNINFFAPILLMQRLAEHALSGLNIINIVDSYAYKYEKGFFSYINSKRALNELTKHAAVLLAPNIRVNAIALGYILKGERESEQHFLDAQKRALLPDNPATIKQLLKTIDFILAMDCLTGQTLMLDGGAHLAQNICD
jgi:NAD(P)-dependent dehydrogenase (short-subunit alcohol dehydrogenase family)